LSKYLYFRRILDIEIVKRNSTLENIRAEVKREHDAMDHFTNSNGNFFALYYNDSEGLAVKAFTRSGNPDNWIRNDFAADLPRNFSPPSTKIATLLANEEMRPYLDRLVREMDE